MRAFGGLTIIALALLAGNGEAAAQAATTVAPAVARAPDNGVEAIAYTKRKSPSLSAGYDATTMGRYNTTPGLAGVAGALIASYLMEKVVGGHITRANALIDPGPELSRRVATAIAWRRGGTLVEPALETKSERPGTLAKEAGAARYLVDVRTTSWFVAPGGDSRSSYPSQYAAALTVLDVRTAVVVTSTTCSWTSPVLRTSDGAAISGDKKTMLHAQFATAADACFDQFMTAVRGAIPPAERREVAVAPAMAPAVDPEVAAASGATYRNEPPRMPPPPRAPAWVGETATPRFALSPRSDLRPPEVRDYAWAEQRETERYREERRYDPPPPPPPEYHSAGRDANGFLVWPGKRP